MDRSFPVAGGGVAGGLARRDRHVAGRPPEIQPASGRGARAIRGRRHAAVLGRWAGALRARLAAPRLAPLVGGVADRAGAVRHRRGDPGQARPRPHPQGREPARNRAPAGGQPPRLVAARPARPSEDSGRRAEPLWRRRAAGKGAAMSDRLEEARREAERRLGESRRHAELRLAEVRTAVKTEVGVLPKRKWVLMALAAGAAGFAVALKKKRRHKP